MVTRREVFGPAPDPTKEFGPAFRHFLLRLTAALLLAGLLISLAAVIGGGFWSYLLGGGGFVVLWLIGMQATIRHGEMVRRAGPLPIVRDRPDAASQRQPS